jgi:hypothetical protein
MRRNSGADHPHAKYGLSLSWLRTRHGQTLRLLDDNCDVVEAPEIYDSESVHPIDEALHHHYPEYSDDISLTLTDVCHRLEDG